MSDTQPSSGQRQNSAGHNARHRARELALQGLYQWLLNGGHAPGIIQHLSAAQGFHKANQELLSGLLHGIIQQGDVLESNLGPLLDRPTAELSPVEHAALLVGAYELSFSVDVPYRVVINEAVELAKTFGGTDGYKYVNGVLDRYASAHRKEEVARNGKKAASSTQ